MSLHITDPHLLSPNGLQVSCVLGLTLSFRKNIHQHWFSMQICLCWHAQGNWTSPSDTVGTIHTVNFLFLPSLWAIIFMGWDWTLVWLQCKIWSFIIAAIKISINLSTHFNNSQLFKAASPLASSGSTDWLGKRIYGKSSLPIMLCEIIPLEEFLSPECSLLLGS